jgi:hypothetical protein
MITAFWSALVGMLGAYWYLLFVFVAIGVVKTPWFKGLAGEFQVNLLLKIRLLGDQYCLKTRGNLLEIDQHALFSTVIFIGDSEFKTTMPSNVTYAGGAISYITSMQQRILSASQVEVTKAATESGRLARGFATSRRHLAHVRKVVTSNE